MTLPGRTLGLYVYETEHWAAAGFLRRFFSASCAQCTHTAHTRDIQHTQCTHTRPSTGLRRLQRLPERSGSSCQEGGGKFMLKKAVSGPLIPDAGADVTLEGCGLTYSLKGMEKLFTELV